VATAVWNLSSSATDIGIVGAARGSNDPKIETAPHLVDDSCKADAPGGITDEDDSDSDDDDDEEEERQRKQCPIDNFLSPIISSFVEPFDPNPIPSL